MSLVSAMNVEQNKGWVCGLRFGLISADKYMEILKRKTRSGTYKAEEKKNKHRVRIKYQLSTINQEQLSSSDLFIFFIEAALTMSET